MVTNASQRTKIITRFKNGSESRLGKMLLTSVLPIAVGSLLTLTGSITTQLVTQRGQQKQSERQYAEIEKLKVLGVAEELYAFYDKLIEENGNNLTRLNMWGNTDINSLSFRVMLYMPDSIFDQFDRIKHTCMTIRDVHKGKMPHISKEQLIQAKWELNSKIFQARSNLNKQTLRNIPKDEWKHSTGIF